MARKTRADVEVDAIMLLAVGVLRTRGIDLPVTDVHCDPRTGLFTYAGHRVVRYARDRTSPDGATGIAKPYHLLVCDARQPLVQGRDSARHAYTARRDDCFVITLRQPDGSTIDRETKLAACRKCLASLNYLGYRDATAARKGAIRQSFTLDAFFSAHPADDGVVTLEPPAPLAIPDTYPPEWSAISRSVRERADWRCEGCGVRCHTDKALLHTHHVNGVKADLRPVNLRALCVACHRQVLGHETMYVRLEQIEAIEALRSAQGAALERVDADRNSNP